MCRRVVRLADRYLATGPLNSPFRMSLCSLLLPFFFDTSPLGYIGARRCSSVPCDTSMYVYRIYDVCAHFVVGWLLLLPSFVSSFVLFLALRHDARGVPIEGGKGTGALSPLPGGTLWRPKPWPEPVGIWPLTPTPRTADTDPTRARVNPTPDRGRRMRAPWWSGRQPGTLLLLCQCGRRVRCPLAGAALLLRAAL